MDDKRLAEAEAEARRFLKRIDELKACRKPVGDSERGFSLYSKRQQHTGSCPETATIRRASMDLTRALAKLRRG